MLNFLHEYNIWRKEHRQEVQEAKLRKEAMKSPLNYQILDQMFQIWVKEGSDVKMEIQGKDFTIVCYRDDGGNYLRKTTTERIVTNDWATQRAKYDWSERV